MTRCWAGSTMTTEHEHMRATSSDLRRTRLIAGLATYVLLPAAIVVAVAKIAGWLAWPWWLVVAPTVLYLLHPVIIGALGPLMRYLRYRKVMASQDRS
jgi:membrane protein YdbS with pleckstrin-like domain